METQISEENRLDDDLDISGWLRPGMFKTSLLLRILLVLLILIAFLVLGAWFWGAISYFSSLLMLFMSAWLVALILTPLVRGMVVWGLPKIAAIVVAYLLVLVLFSLFTALIVPDLILQTKTLSQNIGTLTDDVLLWFNDTAAGLGVTALDLNQLSVQLQSFATGLLKNALDVVTGLAGFLLQMLLVGITSASLLAGQVYSDREKKKEHRNAALWNGIPPRWHRFGRRLKFSLESNFGTFLGGQLVVGLVYGITVGLVMWLANLPYAVTTGCICGVVMLIPLFGGPLSLLLPLVVTLSSTPGTALIVLPILLVIQTALLNVVLPKIIGQHSGLDPVITLFILLGGAQIAGIWGVLLGVPITGVLVNTFEYLFNGNPNKEIDPPSEVDQLEAGKEPSDKPEG